MEEIRSRRGLLKAAGVLLPALPLALSPMAALAGTQRSRELRFYHTHTSEKLSVVYAEDGAYIPQALDEINHLLRDFRSGVVHPIDPRLLDVLYEVRMLSGSSGQYEIISAFRSPSTNEMLRHKSTGVAQKSLHLQGQAVDVRLDGVATSRLRRAALSLARGGVGYYPDSDFVHLDTGRVRAW